MHAEAKLRMVAAMRDSHPAARAHQTYAIGEVVSGTLRAVQAYVRRLSERYRRFQEAQAVYEALNGLDDHTLHDLGFDRSELHSVAAEVGGIAEPTRVRTVVQPQVHATSVLRAAGTHG